MKYHELRIKHYIYIIILYNIVSICSIIILYYNIVIINSI